MQYLLIYNFKNKNENIKTEENLENEKILEIDEEIDEEALEKEEQYINNLDQDTQDALNIKRTKLQEHLVKRREYNRKRQAGYRQTETYKKYTQTEEFKQKEKERYNKRKLTDEFKQYKKEYYKNNIEQINATKERIRKSKMKTTLVNTDTEKDNFRDWLNLNVYQKTKGNLIWFDLLDKFLGYRTSALISKIYKKYFTDYCIEKYSNINCDFTQFKLDGKNPYGYRNFKLITVGT